VTVVSICHLFVVVFRCT